MDALVDNNVTMMVASRWRITCVHGPEIIDRVMSALRKRGITADRFSYEHEGPIGYCSIEFVAETGDTNRIHKNMLRLSEVHEVDTGQPL